MLTSFEILKEIEHAILTFDEEKAYEVTKKALEKGLDPIEIIDKGFTKALRIAGKKFENEEFFITDLVAAAEAAKKPIKELLEPEIQKRREERKALGKFVIGTVAGDIHDIGKNIVATLLFASGFEVFDLGVDVPAEKFVEKAKEVNADIVGASALLSTSLPQQEEIVKSFVSAGIRDKVKIMFGGAPVTEEWVKKIGGDAYAEDAIQAVKVAKELLGIKE
jgi:corrinoid protein of di/trimethylamine methyltransferase